MIRNNFRKSRRLHIIEARLARLPICGHAALRTNSEIEGYRNYIFGARAGPDVCFTHLAHEIAHAAQFGKENFRWRAKDFGFVFEIPKKFVYDRYCVEPVTIQATVRELETFAYQLHILIKSGYKKTPQSLARELVESIRFMPDWLLIPGDTSKAKLDWCLAQVLQRYQQLSTEEVFAKINDWLDATEKRLKRKSKTTPTPALDDASPLSL